MHATAPARPRAHAAPNAPTPPLLQPPCNAALVPVTLIGAAAGAAVVYSVEEGDAAAVRRKLLPRVRRHAARARDEVVALAEDVRRDAAALAREKERAARALAEEGRRLAPKLEQAAVEAERLLLPRIEAEIERGRREVERSLRELDGAEGRGGGGGGRRWHSGGSGERSLVRHFLGGGDSDSD
jgi:hypothetical protein